MTRYPVVRDAHPSLPVAAGLALALACLFLIAPAHPVGAETLIIPIDQCGDGICQSGETATSCPSDCGYCGDGLCYGWETCSSCLQDCTSKCLSFTLSSELKKSGCSGDDDGDCLDNAKESDLAWIIAPYYYYDEDEGCAGAWYVPNPNVTHYGRKDFFQVRPYGSNVDNWSSGSWAKTVWVTFFLLHPHDCQSYLGAGGHQGDSEHVRFQLKSLDLRKWVITLGEYHHHNDMHNYSGAYLKSRASEIGTVYPNVAADEDGHGSWPGERGWKSACAGDEDNFWNDCFKGDFDDAFRNGYREILSTNRNIGGPSPESWRTSVVSTYGGGAYNWFDVGHGSVREYWTPGTNGWQKFCGWECSRRYASSGDCYDSIHADKGCSSPLSQKVDDRYFTNGSSSTFRPAAELSSLGPGADLGRLRSEVADAVYALPEVPYETARAWRERVREAWDPVAEAVPVLAGRSPAEQLETLRWMLEAAPDKLESAPAAELVPAAELTEAERRWVGESLVRSLVGILEAEGVRQPARFRPLE